jgi:hypothetical protein
VSTQSYSSASKLSTGLRCALGLMGTVLIAMLCVAVALQPEPRGRGTHQQLGLPPCTFVMLWNKPCPTCGMTTSWANLVRGRVPSALKANVAGTLLATIAIAAGPWLLWSALRGKTVGRLPSDGTLVVVALSLMTVTLLDWGWRLWTGL